MAIWHQAPQPQCQKRGQRADREHPLPAPMRHDPEAHEQRHEDGAGEDGLEAESEPAAKLRPRHLVDVGGRDRVFGAEAQPLEHSEDQERRIVPGERAADAECRDDRERPAQRRQPPEPLGDIAERDRAHELAEKSHRDEKPDLPRPDVPGSDQDRQHEGNGERIERIEEIGDSDDRQYPRMPSRERQTFEPRDDRLLRDGDFRHRVPLCDCACLLLLPFCSAPTRKTTN